MIEIEVERGQLNKLKKKFKNTPNDVPKIVKKAINQSMKVARVEVADEAKERYTLKKKSDIKKHVYVERKATTSKLEGVMTFRGQKISLAKFKTSPAKPNPNKSPEFTKAKLLVDSSLKKLKGDDKSSKAFLAKMPSGHIGVFERMKGTSQKSDKNKEKIKELAALSVPQMFNNDRIKTKVLGRAANSINEQIKKETKRVLESR